MVLGRGAYAKVVLVEHRRSKTLYAMKILNKNHIVQKQQAEHTMTERHILSSTSSHPFVCHLKFAFRTETTLNLVMDYCPGGELFYHLSREGCFEETRARFIAAELTLALGHLHANSVVYRDLKPENVLIDADGHVKLADFGLSKEGILNVASGAYTFCGTPEYLAPEVLLRKGHGTAVDWWSLGALLYEMLVGLPPWYSSNRKEMYQGITHGILTFPENKASPLARHVISLLLEKDPVKRLGSRCGVFQVRGNPFFEDIDWQALYEKRYKAPWTPPQNGEGTCFDTVYTQQHVTNSVPNQSYVVNSQYPDFAGFSWYADFPENSPPAGHAGFTGKPPSGSPPPSTSNFGQGSFRLPAGSPPAFSRLPTGSPPPPHVPFVADAFEEGILAVRDRVNEWDLGIEDMEDSEDESGNRFNFNHAKEEGLLFDMEIEDQII